jgi:membrane fusion protein, heavy metal efflux system
LKAPLTKLLLIASCLLQITLARAENILGCLIEPEKIAEIGTQVIGVTDKVLVERGDYVKKGQVLATLKSDLERANASVAKTRSQFIADVRTAEANLNLAKLTERRGDSLVKQKYISQQALDKSHAETAVAEQRLAYAREQLLLQNGELQVANAQLNMRAIRSPISGIIAERYIWPGERVEEKPLFRVVSINPLRVEVVAPVALYGSINKGDFITVTPNMPNATPMQAKVVMVDKLIDGASNTFRIRARLDNPNSEIPSGLRCKASIDAVSEAAANLVVNPSEPPLKKSDALKFDKKAP